MGLVYETIQDGICQGRVWQVGMPVGHGDLTSDQGGRATVAVIEDLQEVAGLGGRQRVAQSIVQDQQGQMRQAGQQFRIRAIGLCQVQGIQQARGALIAHTVVLTTGSLAQGRR